MSAQVEELADNKVRLTVDVPRADVHHAVEHAASDLAESVKIPGFRKGKVPMPVLVSRIGKERLYSEAIESHIAGWYGNAVARARIRPAEQPDVDHELNVLRSTVAELSPVEDRPAQQGDTVVIDLIAGDGGQRDYVVELGSGRLLPELEEQLVGMSPGETKDVELDRPGEEQTTGIQVLMKEIKEKVLPPLDDELARSASEFDTLEELRADVEQRLREQLDAEANEAFRRALLDRLVEASNVRVSGPVVDARTRTLLRELDSVMRRSGGPLEEYLQLSGEPAENLVARLREQAAASVAGELVLEAAADQLGIDVSEEEVEEAFRDRFDDADTVLEQAREAGAFESERESMRMARTLDRIAQEVERVPPEQAEARERIWTPDKEKPKTEAKLWT